MKAFIFLSGVLILSGLAAPASAFTRIETAPRAANGGQVQPIGQNRYYSFPKFFFNGYGYNGYGNNQGYRQNYGQGYGQKHKSYQYRDRLPRRIIYRSLQAQRYCNISSLRFRRGWYHARAMDSYGRRVRLLIDPFSGEVRRARYR